MFLISWVLICYRGLVDGGDEGQRSEKMSRGAMADHQFSDADDSDGGEEDGDEVDG